METKTSWTSTELKAMSKQFDEWLRLSTYPAAVRLLKSKKELDEARDESGRPVRRVTESRLTICQFLAQARYMGRTLVGDIDSLGMCSAGNRAMGFKELPDSYADGYVRAYYTDEAAAQKSVSSMPSFKLGSFVGMMVSPLHKMSQSPDVVIFFGKTSQISRFIQAYLYNIGGRMEFSSSVSAMCADVITLPILTGKPHIGIPGTGARMLSWPSDDELAIGVPAAALEQTINGMDFTHRGGVRYPPTWMNTEWEPPPGTIIRNVLEGKGFYPPELRHPKMK
jgi:uncharacterized protein (DUF169 family)